MQVVQPQVARVIYARGSENGSAELEEYDERDDTVRAVPSPKNQRKEPTVQTGREGSPDPKFWPPVFAYNTTRGRKPDSSRRKTVLIVAIESLIAYRGLLFATTHFKTSMQYLSHISGLSGESRKSIGKFQTSSAESMCSPSSPLMRRVRRSRSCAPSPLPAELRSERATSAASLVSMRPSRTCVVQVSSMELVWANYGSDIIGATEVVGSGLPQLYLQT